MPEILKSDSIILDSIRWKESSKIVTLFSREYGIFKVIARGVYRNKSTFAGKLESLNRVEVIVNSRSSRSLQILTEVDIIDTFKTIRLDLKRLSYALAILELIGQTIRESHSDTVFYDFIIVLLDALQTTETPAVIFIYFLLKLNSYLGFKPNLDHCQVCENNPSSSVVYFSLEKGSIFCKDCAEGAAMLLKIKSDDLDLLRKLQNHPYRKISEFKPKNFPVRYFTNLLVDYLNFHTETNMAIKSLSMLI